MICEPSNYKPVACVCSKVVADPTVYFTYEKMKALNDAGRIMFMRDTYACAAECMAKVIAKSKETDDNVLKMEDARDNYLAASYDLNQALVNLEDGVPTSDVELTTTYLGETRDELSCSTRRTRPIGTVFKDMDSWIDGIELGTTPIESTFDTSAITNDIPDADFTGITYEEDVESEDEETTPIERKLLDFEDDSNKDLYSEEHESCLTELPCTYEEPDIPDVVTEDIKVDYPDEELDLSISDDDITTGCANGDGLFDKLMTAIDSSITLQAKANRIDPKTFGQFYAGTISSSLHETLTFLIQEKRLDLDVAKFELEVENSAVDNAIKQEEAEYRIALMKAQTQEVLLRLEERKKKIPLELAILTQEAKSAEKQVELTSRNIELAKANIQATYGRIAEERKNNRYTRSLDKASTEKVLKDIKETTLNGFVNRNSTRANIENTRVNTRVAKFDTILRKEQAYQTRVRTAEEKATGSSQRRVMNADVQSKNKQASLYEQQRKGYIQRHKENVFRDIKDMWTVQLDNVGAENMVVEAIKGPEMSAATEAYKIGGGL